MIKKISLLTLVALLAVACTSVPVTGRKQLLLVSGSEMQAMSYSQYDKVLNESKVITGTADAKMIKRVGANIQKAVEEYMADKGLSDRLSGFAWDFNLIDEDVVNAWCMPGGKVAFYTGILPVCEGEKGVAIVMGHEIAHAIAEHGAERMSQGLIAQGILTGVSVATMNESPAMQQVYQTAVGFGANVGILKFSRQHESEADEMGLIFAAMAGYDPSEAPKFWERMKALSSGGAPPEFLSTHPSHDRRISDLNAQLPRAMEIYQTHKRD